MENNHSFLIVGGKIGMLKTLASLCFLAPLSLAGCGSGEVDNSTQSSAGQEAVSYQIIPDNNEGLMIVSSDDPISDGAKYDKSEDGVDDRGGMQIITANMDSDEHADGKECNGSEGGEKSSVERLTLIDKYNDAYVENVVSKYEGRYDKYDEYNDKYNNQYDDVTLDLNFSDDDGGGETDSGLGGQCTSYTFMAFGDTSDMDVEYRFQTEMEITDQFSYLKLVGDFGLADLSAKQDGSDLVVSVAGGSDLRLVNYFEGLVPNTVFVNDVEYPGKMFLDFVVNGKDPSILISVSKDHDEWLKSGRGSQFLDDLTLAEYQESLVEAGELLSNGLNLLGAIFGIDLMDNFMENIDLIDVVDAFDDMLCL